MRLSVLDSSELRATIAAAKASDREIAKQMRKQTKAMAEPEWKKAIAGRVSTLSETRALHDTARVAVSDQNVTLKSANIKGKKFSGGATAPQLFGGLEFGSQGGKTSYTNRSRAGRSYPVTRRTREQFPSPVKRGRIVYPAAANIIPRIASLWVQTVLRTFMETIERK